MADVLNRPRRRRRPAPVLLAADAVSRSSTRRAAPRSPTRSATRSRARCARRAPTSAPCYATSLPRQGDPRARPRRSAAGFLGCEPHEIIFGPNMTSLDFTLSRTAGRDFAPGDEILVSSLDHDGGVAPWLELAHDRDLVVQPRRAAARHDARLRRPRAQARPSARGWSRSRGRRTRSARSSTPRASAELAHEVGALAWIDAVHYAAHEPIDVRAIDADVLICSPYKFCGPHLGIAYGRAAVLESLAPVQGAAGADDAARAAVRDRHAALRAARRLQRDDRLPRVDRRLRGDRPVRARARRALPGRRCRTRVTVYGLPTMEGRVPTFLVNVDGVPAADVVGQLAEREIGVWAHDSLVLAEPLQAPRLRARRDPDRLHPLQHGRRGRPAVVGGLAAARAAWASRPPGLALRASNSLDEPGCAPPTARGSWRWAISLPSTCDRRALRADACPRRAPARRRRSGGSARSRSARPSRSAARRAGRASSNSPPALVELGELEAGPLRAPSNAAAERRASARQTRGSRASRSR